MTTTLCWHCNAPYPIYDRQCPSCGATNANVDLDRVQAECMDPTLIEAPMPALLREQAA